MNGHLEFMETRKVCLLLYLQKLSIRLRFPLKSAKMRFYCTYNLEKSATGYFHYATLNIIAIEFALYLHRKIWCSTTSCIMRIYFGQIFIHIFWPVSFLIRHPSKTPFKAPFKNRFFGIRYPYPRSGALTTHNHDCECLAQRIRLSSAKEAVLKGCLKEGLRRVSY